MCSVSYTHLDVYKRQGTDRIDEVDTTLAVAKNVTSEAANGETYALGEEISYEITVTNKGNVPYKNVVVTDDLTGERWTIDALAVGESKSFETRYTVTEDDLVEGHVLNVATAKADPIDDPKNPENPKTPEGSDGEDTPTDKPAPSLFVSKTTVSAPANGKTYALGETIRYEITVLNNGNVTITDITVTDELTGDSWTIDALAVGEKSEAFTASHVVTEEDVLAGKVVNVATAAEMCIRDRSSAIS